MSYILLCKGKKAELPYTIADLRKKLYTIEELCFYIYDNTVLCGEELKKRQLADWIEKQCGFADLADSIRIILKKERGPEHVAAQIFSYTDYLNKTDREAVCERIRKYSQLNLKERKKMQADHYAAAGQFQEAIRAYEEMLLAECYDGEKEKHHILYDIGCCYGALFYYNLAYDFFMKAAKTEVQRAEDLLAALYCKKKLLTEEEYKAFLKKTKEFEKIAPDLEKAEKKLLLEYEKRPEAADFQKELYQAKSRGETENIIEKKLAAYKAEI